MCIRDRYGLLVSLTDGDAKDILKRMVESGEKPDGFRGLAYFQRRCDTSSASEMLRNFHKVLFPKRIASWAEVGSIISRWELDAAAIRSKYGEELSPNMKSAILLGMLDEELHRAVLQRGAVRDSMAYSEIRDFVIGYAKDSESRKWEAKAYKGLNPVEGR